MDNITINKMDTKNNIVELPLNEFKDLIKELKNCRNDRDKLINTVNFLNNEIKSLNNFNESNNLTDSTKK